jgi:hypothetical protein
LHLSLIILHILIALLSARLCPIYAKPIFSNSSFNLFAQLSTLCYLSAICNMFLLYPESSRIINITSISQSCLQLFPSTIRA